MSEVSALDPQPRGFAGLASLASVMPPAPAVAPVAPVAPTIIVAKGAATPISQASTTPRDKLSFGAAGRKVVGWIFGVGSFALISALIRMGSHQATYSNQPTYTPPQNNYPAYAPAVPAPPAPQYVPQAPASTTYNQFDAATYDDGSETKPKILPNQVLSASEIRYCLSEDVRINALRQAGSDTDHQFVARFNARVTDYNSRCTGYRYYKTVFAKVQREVQANSAEIRRNALAWENLN